MAKGTKPIKHGKGFCQHCEEQSWLTLDEYNHLLALGGKPQPKTIANAMDNALYTQGYHI